MNIGILKKSYYFAQYNFGINMCNNIMNTNILQHIGTVERSGVDVLSGDISVRSAVFYFLMLNLMSVEI